MTKLTAWIVAGALVAGGISIALFKRSETSAPQTPAATAQGADADQPADTSAAQIEQVPRPSQELFMPPASDAVGATPAPRPAPK